MNERETTIDEDLDRLQRALNGLLKFKEDHPELYSGSYFGDLNYIEALIKIAINILLDERIEKQ